MRHLRKKCPRRYRMKDGTVRTNPGRRNPDILELMSPPDETIRLLRFERIATLFEAYKIVWRDGREDSMELPVCGLSVGEALMNAGKEVAHILYQADK